MNGCRVCLCFSSDDSLYSDKEKVRAVKKIGSEVIFFKPLTEMFSSDRFCYFNTIFEIITKLYNYSTVSM